MPRQHDGRHTDRSRPAEAGTRFRTSPAQGQLGETTRLSETFVAQDSLTGMDHTEAVRIGAVELYHLGLFRSFTQAQHFERHFFACEVCAAELRALVVLEANARAVFLVEAAPPSL